MTVIGQGIHFPEVVADQLPAVIARETAVDFGETKIHARIHHGDP